MHSAERHSSFLLRRLPFLWSGRRGWQVAGLLLLALFLALQAGSLNHTAGRGGPVDRLDALLYDWRFQLLPPQREDVLPIVIVDLDEATQQREGRWPWDRARVADLLRAMRAHGAAIIGFDVVFSEPGLNPASQILDAGVLSEEAREALQQQAAAFDGDAVLAGELDPFVVLGFFLHADGANAGALPSPFMLLDEQTIARSTLRSLPDYTASLPQLAESGAGSGFVVAIPDADGVVRRMPMVLRQEDGVYASLSLEMARLALNAPWLRLLTAEQGERQVVTGVQVGRHLRVPLDDSGNLLVPYRGGGGSYTTISATGVMRGDAPPEQLAALENALVLVGTSALGLSDLRTTPLETGFPGVEAHANVLDALLQAGLGLEAFYYQPDWAPGAALVLSFGAGLLLALLLPGRSPRLMLAFTAGCLVLVVAGNAALWHYWRMALPLAAPLLIVLALALMNIVGGYLSVNRQRRAIQGLFSEYVPAAYVERMVSEPDAVNLSGEQRNMTVLFSDVRSFTALSEHLSASELKALLNRYLSTVTEIIFQHHGTIDKYVGDLVMAFWNAPLDDEYHARHGVAAALAMQERMHELRREFAVEGLPELHIGVGLNTGSMNVGDMGSRYRRAYTVLGDAVNLGSRLEGLTDFYGVPILVSAATRKEANEFLYRTVDRVRVKGRREAVEIFQPLCLASDADEAMLERLARFEQAVADYRCREWEAARAALLELQAQQADRLHALYLERMQGDETELPANWDAIQTHSGK